MKNNTYYVMNRYKVLSRNNKKTTKLNNYEKKFVGEYALSYDDGEKCYMKVSKSI